MTGEVSVDDLLKYRKMHCIMVVNFKRDILCVARKELLALYEFKVSVLTEDERTESGKMYPWPVSKCHPDSCLKEYRNPPQYRRAPRLITLRVCCLSCAIDTFHCCGNILLEFGIPEKLVMLTKTCLNEPYSKVRLGKLLFDKFPIQNGLKQ
jgi:hypothetical protein